MKLFDMRAVTGFLTLLLCIAVAELETRRGWDGWDGGSIDGQKGSGHELAGS